MKKDSKRYPNNSLRNKIQLRLRDVFGDLEIIDAKKALILLPSGGDFRNGIQTDPHGCGFQKAAGRMCGSKAAVVFGAAAYFDYPDEDGVVRIHRHIPSRLAREAINTFDREGAGAVKVDRTYVFDAPTKSHTRAYINAHGKKLRTGPRKVILQAWHANKKVHDDEIKLKQTIADGRRQKERLQNLTARMSPAATTVVETEKEVARLAKQATAIKERLREMRVVAEKQNREAAKLREKPFQRKRVVGHHLNVRNGIGFMNRAKKAERDDGPAKTND